MKPLKKESSAEVIFDVSNDQAGKLVSAQYALKFAKKPASPVVIWEVSNDQAGKLVSAPP